MHEGIVKRKASLRVQYQFNFSFYLNCQRKQYDMILNTKCTNTLTYSNIQEWHNFSVEEQFEVKI